MSTQSSMSWIICEDLCCLNVSLVFDEKYQDYNQWFWRMLLISANRSHLEFRISDSAVLSSNRNYIVTITISLLRSLAFVYTPRASQLSGTFALRKLPRAALHCTHVMRAACWSIHYTFICVVTYFGLVWLYVLLANYRKNDSPIFL